MTPKLNRYNTGYDFKEIQIKNNETAPDKKQLEDATYEVNRFDDIIDLLNKMDPYVVNLASTGSDINFGQDLIRAYNKTRDLAKKELTKAQKEIDKLYL